MKASDGGPVELINGRKGEGREKKKEGNVEIRRRGVRADVRGRDCGRLSVSVYSNIVS